jgi:hypothetical protein
MKATRYLWSKMHESSIKRLIRSYMFDKEKFAYKESLYIFSDIYDSKTDLWGQTESKSGGGSTLTATVALREKLPEIIEKYNITRMLDIPCGDFNWMKKALQQCNTIQYTGGDIVPAMIENNQKHYANEKVQFRVLDITKDELLKADLIFCRECLQHLSDENVKKALINFKRSEAKYLLVTSFPKTLRNWDILDGDYRPLNLRKKPFNLPKPILEIKETKRGKYDIGFDKRMYLYELDMIKF